MGKESKRIFVGGLSDKVTQEELQLKFSKFGYVNSVELKTKRDALGGPPNIFAFVDLATDQASIEKCFSLLGNSKWKGSHLKLGIAKENFLDRLKKEREEQNAEPLDSGRNHVPEIPGQKKNYQDTVRFFDGYSETKRSPAKRKYTPLHCTPSKLRKASRKAVDWDDSDDDDGEEEVKRGIPRFKGFNFDGKGTYDYLFESTSSKSESLKTKRSKPAVVEISPMKSEDESVERKRKREMQSKTSPRKPDITRDDGSDLMRRMEAFNSIWNDDYDEAPSQKKKHKKYKESEEDDSLVALRNMGPSESDISKSFDGYEEVHSQKKKHKKNKEAEEAASFVSLRNTGPSEPDIRKSCDGKSVSSKDAHSSLQNDEQDESPSRKKKRKKNKEQSEKDSPGDTDREMELPQKPMPDSYQEKKKEEDHFATRKYSEEAHQTHFEPVQNSPVSSHLRFDPTRKDHQKYILSPIKQKKTKKPKSKEEEEEKDEKEYEEVETGENVDKPEKSYKVAEDLKSRFETKKSSARVGSSFSLLAALGSENDAQDYGEEMEDLEDWKVPDSWDPLGSSDKSWSYGSSYDYDGSVNESSFFVLAGDPRLQEGVDFTSEKPDRKELLKKWRELKPKLKIIWKKKHRDALREDMGGKRVFTKDKGFQGKKGVKHKKNLGQKTKRM